MIRAVLFDAGNTLLFLDYVRLANAVGKAVGHPLTAELLQAQAKPAALLLERGQSTDRERASRYLEALFLMAGVPGERLPQVRDTLLALHQERHLWSGFDPGTPAALDQLRAAGFRLGVVSNSDGRVDEALLAAGLHGRFEVVLDSQLVGFEKPDPRIFAEALRRLGMPAADTLYVGDIYEVDVVGARAAGMPVVLLDPLGNHQGRDVPTVPSIAELAGQLLRDPRPFMPSP